MTGTLARPSRTDQRPAATHRETSGTGMRMFNRATGGVFVLAGAYLLTLERPR